MSCRRRVGVFSLVAVLAAVAAANADNGRGEQLKFNAADQAAARAGTITRADLSPASGWKGGPKKPDLSPPPSCPNYAMDLTPFVITGAAETDWTRGPLDVDSEVEILQTTSLVGQEWKVEVASPAAIRCIRSYVARTYAAHGGKLVSFREVGLPRLATYSAAYRMEGTINASGFTATVVDEIVLFGKGRTEVTLNVSGLSAQTGEISASSLRYARMLAARIRT